MAPSGKIKDKYSLLEELYDGQNPGKNEKFSLKDFFADSQKVEKILSGAILTVGLVAIMLGFFQIRGAIDLSRWQRMFALNDRAPVGSSSDETPDLLGLKDKDTDRDGLSDYDELYLHQTSPYLPDTDSDGTDDKTEISQGSDPSCLTGQNCFDTWSQTGGTFAAPATLAADSLYANAASLSANQIREMLLQSGMSGAELDAISDDDLLRAYQQIVSESQTPAATGETGTSINVSLNEVQNMSPAQVRQLLIEQAGISAAALEKVTDADLMILVKQVLASQSGVASQTNTANLTWAEIQNLSPEGMRQYLAEHGISREILNNTSDADLLELVRQTFAGN